MGEVILHFAIGAIIGGVIGSALGYFLGVLVETWRSLGGGKKW